MALDTFAPPVAPSPGSTMTPALKIREVEFGDGYTQPLPDGLNHIRMTIQLNWDGLTEAEMNTIWAFLVAHKGTTPFYYQTIGDADPRKWTCKEFERRKSSGLFTLSATLVESFLNLS